MHKTLHIVKDVVVIFSPRGGTLKILISISTTNPTYTIHTMLEDIQEHMCALIAQHGSVLAALATFRQQLEAQ